MNRIVLFFSFLLIISDITPKNISKPKPNSLPNLHNVNTLPRAYAHNDYQHANPLFSALKLGFTYIEVDIHFMNGELYVSHRRPLLLNKERTLSKLYLEPLLKIYEKHQGRIFPNQEKPLVLMIDLKTEAESTYRSLKEALIPYQKMLCSWENMKENRRAVQIVITGNRPIQTILAEQIRYVQVDGRIKDLPKKYPPEFMPIISENYTNVFGYKIFMKNRLLTVPKLEKIAEINHQVHAQGKIIRLWNSPEDHRIWDQLIHCGIDLINTDKLVKLNNYLINKEEMVPF